MSGGLDIRPFPNNWEMKKQLGEEASNKQRWDEHTVINQLDKIKMCIRDRMSTGVCIVLTKNG